MESRQRVGCIRRTALLTAVLGGLLLSCSPATERAAGSPSASSAPTSPAAPAPAAAPREPATPAADTVSPTPPPEKVRDAFAGLQATLDDTCTPGAGDCAYFLGRVHDELQRLMVSRRVV